MSLRTIPLVKKKKEVIIIIIKCGRIRIVSKILKLKTPKTHASSLVSLMAAPPLLIRALPHLRLHLHLYLRLNPTLPAAVCSLVRRPCHTTTTATESPRPIRKPPSTTTPPPPPPTTTTTTYDDKAKTSLLTKKQRYPKKDSKWENDPDYRKWKDKESEILLDIDPITLLIKDILHSERLF